MNVMIWPKSIRISQEGGQMHKLAMILCVMSVSLGAQWANYPTSGMPDAQQSPTSRPRPAIRGWQAGPVRSLAGQNGSFYHGDQARGDPAWAAALYKQREDDYRRDTDGIVVSRQVRKPAFRDRLPMKIVQTPTRCGPYEYETSFARFLRWPCTADDPNPTWMGYSIGHWDGDTLGSHHRRLQ